MILDAMELFGAVFNYSKRNPFSQWQHNFQWKLRSHWLKVLR